MPEVVMAESCHRGWGGQKIQDGSRAFAESRVTFVRSPSSCTRIASCCSLTRDNRYVTSAAKPSATSFASTSC